jgi:hypothetical protein
VTDQNAPILGADTDDEQTNSLGVTASEFDALTDEQKEELFVQKAVEQGTSEADAHSVYDIITRLSPPITVKAVDFVGLPVGDAELRVAREWDTTNDAHLDQPGWTDIILHTPLGALAFTIDKAALIQALTVVVPYVSPQTAPAEA